MDSGPRSIPETIRLWAQAVAIPVGVALVGIWQAWLHDFVLPSRAPVNLTTEVKVREAGFKKGSGPDQPELEGIELSVSAFNPSTRNVFLMANYWSAYGVKIIFPNGNDKPEDWLTEAVDAINTRSPNYVLDGKHFKIDSVTWIATRSAFNDSVLRPQEKLSNSFVFYVPRAVYDSIIVRVNVPTASKEDPAHYDGAAIGIEYKPSLDQSSLDEVDHYRVKENLDHEILAKQDDGRFPEKTIKTYGMQKAGSFVELSLWPHNSQKP